MAVRYALLRDGRHWEGQTAGLEVQADGALALIRVPAPAAGNEIQLDAPYDAPASGIAAGGDAVFVSDTDAGCVLIERLDCGFRYSTSRAGAPHAPLAAPAGLALDHDMLWVADSGNARVQGFLQPAMELHRSLHAGMSKPTAVAVDHSGWLYVLDTGLNRILRFSAEGTQDAGYSPAVTQPVALALGDDDTLYVSDAADDSIRVFDAALNLQRLVLPALTPAMRPRALAVHGNTVLAADAALGSILVFDRTSRACVGSIPGFRGPVAAMAYATNGDLLVKADGTDAYSRFPAETGSITWGTLTVGPLDAGELSDWERVVVRSTLPQGVSLETQTADNASPPVPKWELALATDCLLAPDSAPSAAEATRRFLWLRVGLHSSDGQGSPRVGQVQAQTTGPTWLDQLPRIYRRDDRGTRFLERWLALLRSDFQDRDDRLDLLFRRFEPDIAPAEQLARLAEVLAFDPPPDVTAQQLRSLLARVPELYRRRGTLGGLEAFAEIYAGFRPKIIEDFRARRVWELGQTSLLGFDTALAAANPEGFVVPHDAVTDPRYAGLRGDYYRGSDFGELVASRTDRTIDFVALRLPASSGALSPFTVRWSGQIKPRYTESYVLDLQAAGDVRLWIDGQLLVYNWPGVSPGDAQPRVALDAARWHLIQLETRSSTNVTKVRLGWSSRSQPLEVVPRDCLYSVLDEHADLSGTPRSCFDVGNAVVGESRPQGIDEFGAGLFSDYAHLFTVIAPAGRCCDADRKRALRTVIDAEKPAHTDYHLCFVEPRMRVGFQARLGIDAIVADRPPAGRLGETVLGGSTYLEAPAPGGLRVGSGMRLGIDTVTG